MISLYDRPIKGTKKLTVQDFREIARFNRIVLNYIKICKIETNHDHGQTHRH